MWRLIHPRSAGVAGDAYSSLFLSAAVQAPLWFGRALTSHRETSNAAHARAAVDWLRGAAKRGGAGFAHSLHFARGWLPAYPETTGYIIPSLDLAARHLDTGDVSSEIEAARDWLARIQHDDGAFPDLAGNPQVFDTGQILIGANYLLRTGDAGIETIVRSASAWLAAQQSPDGSFVAHAYNNLAHAYYSRVGAALLDAAVLTGDTAAHSAGTRNLQWTLAQQKPDGWFAHMSFADHPPYSHTIVYTLEGLLAGHRIGGDTRLLDAVVRTASVLRSRIAAHGGVIRSQYREGFVAIDEEICVTGLCQWSALCFRLDRLGVSGFRAEAERSLLAAKRLQMWSPLKSLHGALPGSVPFSGRYMRFALPNWGVKFFLDALLEADGGDDLPALI